jgi:hypothetical protein
MIQLAKLVNWAENRGLYLITLGSLMIGLAGAFGMMQVVNLAFLSSQSRILKKDICYLKNGDVLTGYITSETPQKVNFEFEQGAVDFQKEEIKEIKRDFYSPVLTEMW